jgi:hypothetical protein
MYYKISCGGGRRGKYDENHADADKIRIKEKKESVPYTFLSDLDNHQSAIGMELTAHDERHACQNNSIRNLYECRLSRPIRLEPRHFPLTCRYP